MSNILNLNCISVIQYPSISLVNYHIGGKLVPNLCCVLGCRVGDPDEVFLTRLFSNYVLCVVHISMMRPPCSSRCRVCSCDGKVLQFPPINTDCSRQHSSPQLWGFLFLSCKAGKTNLCVVAASGFLGNYRSP